MDTDRIPVVICIDVEPDARQVQPRLRSPWRGFAPTRELLEPFREQAARLSDGTAHFTWLLRMDPQVRHAYGRADWVVEAHAPLIEDLAAAGDEMGLHTHAWRWDAGRSGWLNDYADASWIDECLGLSFSAFLSALGRSCETFRFGDRWMDETTFRRLEALGVRYDLTLEPGHGAASFYGSAEIYTGILPDYRDVPTHPYRPSRGNYQMPDPHREDGAWELPVTTARIPPGMLRRLYRRYVLGVPASDVSTALLSLDVSLFRRLVDDALARSVPCLVLPLRSEAAEVPWYAARMTANLAMLLDHPAAHRFAWMTPAAAVACLPTA